MTSSAAASSTSSTSTAESARRPPSSSQHAPDDDGQRRGRGPGPGGGAVTATPGRRARRPSGRRRAEALRAGSASPPCHRMASSRLRARPSCRKRVWPLTSRPGRCPTAAGCATRGRVGVPRGGVALGPAVGQAGPHVVEQEVGVGADRLVGRARRCRDGRCAARRCGTTRSRSLELLLAALGLGRADVAAGRDGERAGVEGDLVELLVVELGVAAVGRAEALRLGPGARLVGAPVT